MTVGDGGHDFPALHWYPPTHTLHADFINDEDTAMVIMSLALALLAMVHLPCSWVK